MAHIVFFIGVGLCDKNRPAVVNPDKHVAFSTDISRQRADNTFYSLLLSSLYVLLLVKSSLNSWNPLFFFSFLLYNK